jgi:hypothetical protein
MLGRKNPYFYELHLELFKYSQEIIETGVPDIDVISDESSYNVPLNMANVTGNFIYKEIVFQSPDGTYANATCQAICAGWSSATDIVNITNIAGDFLANNTVYGMSSGSYGTLASYDPIESSQSYVAYDNKEIQNEANNVVNISESNPFGGIGGL